LYIIGKKFLLTFMLVALVCPIASSYITSNYSFLKNMTITPLSVNGDTVTVSITFDVYFTRSAWKTFRYADGSFPPMSAWWQSHVGQTFSYAGFTGKLMSVQWTMLNHYSDHDHLNVIAKIQYIR
jgi:hypothetical protein